MLHLAIECSGFHGSVAVFQDSEPLKIVKLPTHQSSVQSLALAISHSIQPYACQPKFISITSGPGSFTGLRVGLATAKMLSFAWNIPVVPIDTLQVLAQQMLNAVPYQNSTILIPVVDAFRQQVFTAAWLCTSNVSFVRLSPTQVVSASRWQESPLHSQTHIESLPKCPEQYEGRHKEAENRIIVAGPGLARYLPIGTGPVSHPESNSTTTILKDLEPQAEFVGQLGWKLFHENRFVNAHQLTANYVRMSAAEEKLPK